MRLYDLMTTDVVTVNPGTSVKEAARRMKTANVSGLPVVDASGRVVGILTEGDLVTRVAAQADESDPGAWHGGEVARVSELMSAGVITANAEMGHAKAAQLMVEHGVKRLPVVDSDCRLLGIVSRADIVSVLSRPDQDVAEDVRRDVLAGSLRLEPGQVSAFVKHGRVTLTGELSTHAQLRLMEALTWGIDGVVSVRNDVVLGGQILEDS